MSSLSPFELLASTEPRPPWEPPQRPLIRPRDSASLVLFDRSGDDVRFLMGLRGERHTFMPGHLVFPGGRLEPSDLRLSERFTLSAEAEARLMASTHGLFRAHRATALALTAIRETYEETGVFLASPGFFSDFAEPWYEFSGRALRPAPEVLTPIARAVTPHWFPQRYDTRFFLADRAHVAGEADLDERPSDEFDEVCWVSQQEANERFTLAPITGALLAHALTRIREGTAADAAQPMPFFRNLDGRFQVEYV